MISLNVQTANVFRFHGNVMANQIVQINPMKVNIVVKEHAALRNLDVIVLVDASLGLGFVMVNQIVMMKQMNITNTVIPQSVNQNNFNAQIDHA